MSFVPFGPDKKASEYFNERVEKLVRFDEIRIMELLESFQYGIGYIVICFFLGVSLDFLFPRFDEKADSTTLFLEVSLQCLALIFFVFYGRKVIKVMPFLFNIYKPLFGGKTVPKYRAYESTEYEGEVVIGFVLVATQTNLLKKIDKLSRNLYEWLYGAKRETNEVIQKDEELIKKKIVEDEQVLKKDIQSIEKDIQMI